MCQKWHQYMLKHLTLKTFILIYLYKARVKIKNHNVSKYSYLNQTEICPQTYIT